MDRAQHIDQHDLPVDFCEMVAKEGADELAEGAANLKGSSWKLSLGAGILNAAIPDLSNVPEALKETYDLGAGYDNYSGLADGMKGKVRFIWKQ